MFKKIVVLASIGTAALVLGSATPAGADEPADWVLENCVDAKGNPTTKIETGAKCDLKNLKNGKCLVREGHMGQTDWDFASCSARPRQMQITAKDAGALNCGETFAMKLGNEYFRKCQSPQKVGINICSESKSAPEPMHYDWQLQGCSGQVEAGKAVSLFNVSRKDSVVYAKRPSKVADTCWSDSMKLGQCASARDK
jgi:hypothetical protein